MSSAHAASRLSPLKSSQGHDVQTSSQGKENMPSIRISKDQDAAPAVTACVRDHLNCALCTQIVAAPLVVSCGHMFCGQCLYEFLNQHPMCPTCSVGLRSVPVRCLPVDAVVEALKPGMAPKDKEKFDKRVEEGRSAADKVNKIFWWLAPQAVPIAGAHAGQVGLSFANAAGAQLQPSAALQHQAPAAQQQQQARAKQQHHKQPKRQASMPHLPKQLHSQLHSYMQPHQPLLPLQQALLSPNINPLGMAMHHPLLVPEPSMLLTQHQLMSIMQGLHV